MRFGKQSFTPAEFRTCTLLMGHHHQYFSKHLIVAFFFSVVLRPIWEFFVLLNCEILINQSKLLEIGQGHMMNLAIFVG